MNIYGFLDSCTSSIARFLIQFIETVDRHAVLLREWKLKELVYTTQLFQGGNLI